MHALTFNPPRSRADSGSVGLGVPFSLSALSLCGLLVPFMVAGAEGASEPRPESLSEWLKVFLYIVGAVYLVVRFIKEFRPESALNKRFVERTEIDLRFNEVNSKADANAREIDKLRTDSEGRHRENVKHLEGIDGKLDRNKDAASEDHESLRQEVRHDMKSALQPIQSQLDLRDKDSDAEFRKLAGEIGGLSNNAKLTNEALIRMQQTLETLLSRNPAPARGGSQ